MCDIKSALQEIGVDVENINNPADVAEVIRNECQVAGTVLNATLQAGPGVRITPIERKGYKISSDSDAVLSQDLTDDLTRGTAVQKVLHRIVHHMIPNAIHESIHSPYIVSIEVFKAENDGVDFYDNRAFGVKGQGRKSGLHPFEWYLKIYTMASAEPIYVGLGVMIQALKREIMYDVAHQTERQFRVLMQNHIREYHGGHRPHRPGCRPPKGESFGGFDPDKDFNVEPETPSEGQEPETGNCPICDKDHSFDGFDPEGDSDFNVDPNEGADDLESLNFIDNLKA